MDKVKILDSLANGNKKQQDEAREVIERDNINFDSGSFVSFRKSVTAKSVINSFGLVEGVNLFTHPQNENMWLSPL